MVVIVGFLGQAFIVYLSCNLVPGVEATFRAAFGRGLAVALASLLATWVMTTGTDDGFTSSLVRRQKPAEVEDPEVDGVIFVQLDGVPFPVLRWAVQAGSVATIRRWLATGQYELHEWTPQMPCTTPASQLGLLHGTVDGVPAFRWYDRELGRVLVANRPRDAAVIEERASTGRGLLADGGLSLSNLFTGDAPRSMLTMSQVTLSQGLDPGRAQHGGPLRHRPARPAERAAARRSARSSRSGSRRGARSAATWCPACERGWTFAILRAATNVLQRDLNTVDPRRGDGQRHAQHLRRLRRLRRDRAPRRDHPAGVAGRAGRARPRARHPGAARRARTAALPPRDRLRPRPVPGRAPSPTGTASSWATCAPTWWRGTGRDAGRGHRGLGPGECPRPGRRRAPGSPARSPRGRPSRPDRRSSAPPASDGRRHERPRLRATSASSTCTSPIG